MDLSTTEGVDVLMRRYKEKVAAYDALLVAHGKCMEVRIELEAEVDKLTKENVQLKSRLDAALDHIEELENE